MEKYIITINLHLRNRGNIMKMNQFEKFFFSSVASIIINFILGCILAWCLFFLSWTLNFSGLSEMSKDDVASIIIIFFAFLVPWVIYNIYRYHLWEKFQKQKVIYICTLIIPSFCISLIIIIMNISDYIKYGPNRSEDLFSSVPTNSNNLLV